MLLAHSSLAIKNVFRWLEWFLQRQVGMDWNVVQLRLLLH